MYFVILAVVTLTKNVVQNNMGTRTVKFQIKNHIEIRFQIEDFAFTSAHVLEPNP